MERKSKNGVYFWVVLTYFILSTVVLTILRTIELMYYTNYESGFYNGPKNINVFFFALIGGIFVVNIIVALISGSGYSLKLYKHNNYILKVLTLICAIFAIVYAFFVLVRGVDSNERQMSFLLFNVIFSILASVGFFYIYKRIDAKVGSYADIMTAFPAIWCVYQLMTMFLDHMAVATVYENMLNILRAATLAIFLLNFGKMVSSIEQKQTGRWLMFSGLTTATLGFVTTLSQYLIVIIPYLTTNKWGQGYTNFHIITATPLDFVVTLFVVVFTFGYIRKREKFDE